jgi:hypothetical protein
MAIDELFVFRPLFFEMQLRLEKSAITENGAYPFQWRTMRVNCRRTPSGRSHPKPA